MSDSKKPKLNLPNFIWWTGMVEDNNDPLRLGRCRVRMVGIHTPDKEELPTKSLPWAHCLQPTTSASLAGIGSSPTGLMNGSWVVGFFQDGEDMQHPVIMGSFGGINKESQEMIDSSEKSFNVPLLSYPLNQSSRILSYAGQSDVSKLARGTDLANTIFKSKINGLETGVIGALVPGSGWSEPPSPYKAVYPHNKVFESKSGHVIEIDDTPGAERIHQYHRSGTFTETHPDGTKVEKVVNDNYEIIGGKSHKIVKDDSFLNVEGDSNISIDGNIRIQTSDDCKTIQIYFPNNSRVMMDTGTYVHNVHGSYILNVSGGITIDGKRADLNDPQYAVAKATAIETPYVGRLTPNIGYSTPPEYKTKITKAQSILTTGSVVESLRGEIDQKAAEEGLPSGDTQLDAELFDTNEQIVEQIVLQEAEQNDSVLSQLGEGAANIIGGVAERAVSFVTDSIANIGELGVGIAEDAIYGSEAFQALQQGTALAQQNLAVLQGIANNVQGAAGQICSIIDLFQGLKDVEFGDPAEFWEKIAEGFHPLSELPEAVGDAFEDLVQGAVEAVEEFAAGLVQPFVEIVDQATELVSGVGDLLSDPCGGGGAGIAGAGAGSLSPVSPGAVSGTDALDENINPYQRAQIKDSESGSSVVDSAAIASVISVAQTPFAVSQGGTKIGGSPVMTTTPLGAVNLDVIAPSQGGPCVAVPTPSDPLNAVGGVAGLAALGLAAAGAGAALVSAIGSGDGGVGAQGPTGPIGATGPDEEWDIPFPTKATNFEGIPQGTTFDFGLSPLDILEELLYPSLTKFSSFDIGIRVNGEKVPYHVGDSSISGDYLSTWILDDFESSQENSISIKQEDDILAENIDKNTTEYTITHPEYSRNREGSIDFLISTFNEDEEEVTKIDSIFWRYPLYAGKRMDGEIDSEDFENLSINTTQLGGANPFINYTIQEMKDGITMIVPETEEPEYFYWVVPKRVDEDTLDYPIYGLYTSFTDVSNPNVTTSIPMIYVGEITSTNYGIDIDFDVYRTNFAFSSSKTIRIQE